MSYCDDFNVVDEYCENLIGLNKMSPRKENYVIEGGYYYNTEDEAIDAAKKRVNKTSDDHKVYKAIKLVSPLTPNVQVTDIVNV